MPKQWMPRADWAALKSGDGCPMCAGLVGDVAEPDHVDDHGHTIAELPGSVLRLSANQFSAGYCVLICKWHGPEDYDLTEPQRTAFFADLSRVGAAVAAAMSADKMNYLMLGNAVPHLHAHVVPRYHGDPAPAAPLYGDPDRPVTITAAQSRERTAAIRARLT